MRMKLIYSLMKIPRSGLGLHHLYVSRYNIVLLHEFQSPNYIRITNKNVFLSKYTTFLKKEVRKETLF